MGTVDAWLVWQLTGDFAIEAGNASRTLLLDLQTLEWDPELLDLFGVPIGVLPEVRPSDGGFGRTVGARAASPQASPSSRCWPTPTPPSTSTAARLPGRAR